MNTVTLYKRPLISNKTIKIRTDIDRMIKSRLFFIGAVLLVIMVSGCITTEKGGFEKAKTVDAAVSIRVNAAKQYLQKRDFEELARLMLLTKSCRNKNPPRVILQEINLSKKHLEV